MQRRQLLLAPPVRVFKAANGANCRRQKFSGLHPRQRSIGAPSIAVHCWDAVKWIRCIMFLRVASWLWLLSGLLLCLPRQVNGEWVRNAWIRKYRCDGHSWTHVTFGTTPFWIDSLRGQLDTVNGSTQLSLSILAVHDTALFSCDELDLTALERSLQLKVLGKYTGQTVRLKSICPLPITPDLTPLVPFFLCLVINHG